MISLRCRATICSSHSIGLTNKPIRPLHFHEDYMLSLTLNVKGTRVTGQSVDNFTEKDLIIIFPRVPHCYKRDEAFAETNCEAVAVQFSRDMPNWQIFETESMLPIRKMLSQPVAGSGSPKAS